MICDVAGTVTLKAAPLEEGVVNLYSPSTGVGAAATVTSGTFVFGRTLAPGDYKLSVAEKPVPPTRDGAPPPPKVPIPRKYQEYQSSGLTFTVREGKNTLDIKLD